jgi:hypothetical protein
MATWIAGAAGWGSVYEGLDWDAALDMLDTEIEGSLADGDRGRLMAIRELVVSWRGQEDPRSATERRRLLAHISDPDVVLWDQLGPAQVALVSGRYDEATRLFAEATETPGQNTTDARMGYILAAHLGRDLPAARAARDALAGEPFAGRYIDAMGTLAEAGVAALEGHPAEAVPLYRTAIEQLAQTGARFQVALARLDALTTLPDERSIDGWADEARERFEVVKSAPLLERLSESVAARAQAPGGGAAGARVAVDEAVS